MKTKKIKNYYFIYFSTFFLIFFSSDNSLLLSNEIDDEVDMFRKQFNDILEYENDPSALYQEVDGLMKNKRYAWKNVKEENPEISIYFTIWRIKALFLMGHIDSSKIWYNESKNNDNIISLAEKTDNFKKYLCVKPISSQLSSCDEGCMCNSLKEKYDNLDFLLEENLSQYFTSIKIQIDNGLGKPIPIDRKTYARTTVEKKGKEVSEAIKILLRPPIGKFTKYTEYALDDEREEIVKYYFTKARKNRLHILQERFDNQMADSLIFNKKENFNGETTHLYIKPHIPLIPRSNDRSILQFYQLYVKDKNSDGKINYLSRYSFNIMDEQKNRGKSKDIYLRWNNEWEMAELQETGKIFLLIPKDFIYQSNGKSAFKIGAHELFTRDKKKIENRKKAGITVQRNIDQEYPVNYHEIQNQPGVFKYDNEETPNVIEGYVEVVPVEVLWVEGGEINLELTKDLEEYQGAKKEIEKEEKRLIGVMLACIVILLLPL